MKDKLGHGSEKHRESHKPQVEYGKQTTGTHAQGNDEATTEYNRELTLRLRNMGRGGRLPPSRLR